jgi:diguanylate cyclase (GGDEF)-like protein
MARSRSQDTPGGGRAERAVRDPAPRLQRLLLDLISVQERPHAEREVLSCVRRFLQASWGALYVRAGEVYLTRTACDVPSASARPLPLPLLEVAALPAGLSTPDADSPLHQFAPEGTSRAIRLDFASDESAVILLGPDEGGGATGAADAELDTLLEACAGALRNASLLDHLRSLAVLDPLSGCFNRRGFDEHLRVEISRARRYNRPLALVVVDLDYFKRVNDELGHDVGDEALREFGALLQRAFRATDRVCRFGGDEFAIIFPETTKQAVLLLADRLREDVVRHFLGTEVGRALTASFGVAAFPEDGGTPQELVRSADQALYRAKAEGRNRVAAA